MMISRRHILSMAGASALLAACSRTPSDTAANGQALPVIQRISPTDAPGIRTRMQDRVNSLRSQAEAGPLQLDQALNRAAMRHARDMSVARRTHHMGRDGSAPSDRAADAGYPNVVLGEVVSESYASGVDTITQWMARADTRDVLIDPAGYDMGVGFHQDPNGRIWWSVLVGTAQPRGLGPKPN